jgi:three-Cys-motif partner protein
MKNKWDCRAFIDLYSGPGLFKLHDKDRFIWGSAIHALKVKDSFDKYIFCDQNSEALSALKARVLKNFPGVDASFVVGNCDEKIEEICGKIPKPSKNFRVLSFCFVDPFDLSFKFATIRRLSSFIVDFLILLAVDMDGNRALNPYLNNPTNRKLDEMLGLDDWRERWHRSDRKNFPRFLAEQFATQMTTLGYLPTELDRMKKVRAEDNNRPLYRLALFSKSNRALSLWNEVLKYGDDQRSLWG